jgi:O-antigen/teichoic acid export membrane protein
MGDSKILFRKFGMIGFANFIFSLNSIILLPVLTKNLSVKEYGIWAQITVFLGFAPTILLFGLQYSMARFIPSLQERNDIQELFYSILFFVETMCIFASITIYTFSETISFLFFDGEIAIVHLLSIIILIEPLNVSLLHFFRSMQETKKYTIFLLTQTLIHIFLVSTAVLLDKGIYGATLAILIRGILMNGIMFLFMLKEIGFKIPRFNFLKENIAFGLPTMPSELSTWIVNSSDRFIISFILGAVYVGYYAPAYIFGNNIIFAIITPISLILPPFLAKRYDENKLKDVSNILEHSLKYFLFIGIPATFGLFFLSKTLLSLLTTTEIASQSYLVLSITVLSTLLFGIFTIINQIAILNKKTKVIGKIWLFSAVFKVIFNFLMIPRLGILGAAIVTLFIFMLSLYITTKYCFKIMKLNIDYKFIIKSLLASFVMSIFLLKIEPVGFIQFFASVVASALIYFMIMVVLKAFEKKELIYFKALLFKN